MSETVKVEMVDPNMEKVKKHPFAFLTTLGLIIVGVGFVLTILIITAIIGIPMMIVGFIMIFIGLGGGTIKSVFSFSKRKR
jgi:hypothetical protein